MEEVVRTGEWSGVGASGSEANGNDKTTPVSAVAPAAEGGGHIIMQPVPAASRRPENEGGADKVKRGSDDGFPEGGPEGGSVSMRAPGFSSFAEEEGTCGSSFLTFLSELEQEGIIALHHGEVPPRLKGLCGWTVHDDKLDEWKRRRQSWFMQGKEGKPYKANSLYQFLRRLGFFPTEGTKRASHGLDFDSSRTFKWDGSRRHKYIQSKKEKQALSLHANSRAILRAGPGVPGAPVDLMGGIVMGGWQPPMEPPGRPMPVHHGAAGAGGMFQYPWNLQGLAHPHAQHPHYGAPPGMHPGHPLQHPHAQHPGYPQPSGSGAMARGNPAAPGGENLMRLMSPNGANGMMQQPPQPPPPGEQPQSMHPI